MSFLDGLKTYIVAAVAVLAAVLAFFSGELSLLQMFEAIGIATGVAGTRFVAKAGEIIALVKDPEQLKANPTVRLWLTYAGTAVTVLSALLAGLTGSQDPIVTISAILSALGISFLGLGVKKSVDATAAAPVTPT